MFESYSTYIWTCYGATAAVLILNVWLARRGLADELRNAQRRQQMNKEQQ